MQLDRVQRVPPEDGHQRADDQLADGEHDAQERIQGDHGQRERPPAAEADPPNDPAVLAEQRAILAEALASLPPDDQLAVRLYVVDGIPAEEVARAVGYPSVKTVYNHVYRALALVRARLERAGIKRGDL